MPLLPIVLNPDGESSRRPSAAPAVEWGTIDAEGRLVISPEMRRSLGLEPGARMRLERDGNTIRLHRALGHLAKIYIEPTNACNLDCVTCFRNAWETALGRMADATFAAVLQGVAAIGPAVAASLRAFLDDEDERMQI